VRRFRSAPGWAGFALAAVIIVRGTLRDRMSNGQTMRHGSSRNLLPQSLIFNRKSSLRGSGIDIEPV